MGKGTRDLVDPLGLSNESIARLTCSGLVEPAGEQCVEADPSYLMLLEAEPSLRL